MCMIGLVPPWYRHCRALIPMQCGIMLKDHHQQGDQNKSSAESRPLCERDRLEKCTWHIAICDVYKQVSTLTTESHVSESQRVLPSLNARNMS